LGPIDGVTIVPEVEANGSTWDSTREARWSRDLEDTPVGATTPESV
jgi:hypothetical protein